MARVLGRVRLSVSTEETTSPERQREHIETWAKLHDHTVVGWAEDLDLSGSVSPFEAPNLAPWLKDRHTEWDVMVAYRLDRIARRAVPLNALFGWCEEHGKTLVSTSESIDLGTWIGRMVANVIAGVAEGELEAIRSRVTDSQKALRKVGRYRGGPVPYGFRKVRRDDGWYLEHHPDDADRVRGLIDRYFAGESLRSLALSLNAEGVPSPQSGKAWATSTLSVMFRSRALIGQSTHKGAVVVDEDGMPVQRAEPLISESRFKELQQLLTCAQRRPVGKLSGEKKLLLDVLLCGACGSKLYYHRNKKTRENGKGYDNKYWRCSGRTHPKPGAPVCGERNVPAEIVERLALDIVRDQIGDLPMTQEVYFPAEGVGDELAQVEDAISGVRREKDAGLYEGDEDEYLSRLRVLIERRNALRDTPSKPARYERVPIGGTWREAIEAADTITEQRRILLATGMRLWVRDAGLRVAVVTDVHAVRAMAPGALPGDGPERAEVYLSPDVVPAEVMEGLSGR